MTGLDLLERTFEDQQIRLMVDPAGEPWFLGKDVCNAIGLANVSQALAGLDNDERSSITVADGTPGNPTRAIISESGLYTLVLRSNRPEAKAFRRWITGTVLPEIRRTGSFSLVPQTYAQALRAHADAIEAQEAAEQRALAAESVVESLTPAAEAWSGVADADGDHSLREAAQMLARAGVDTGQNRLARYLRDINWTDRKGRPYQQHVEAGRLAVRTRTYLHPRTNEEQVTTQVRVTPKGVEQLLQRMTASTGVDTPTAVGAEASPMGDSA